MIAAIIAAAGSGERFGAAIPKALIQLGDRTLIEHAVSSISSVADQISSPHRLAMKNKSKI